MIQTRKQTQDLTTPTAEVRSPSQFLSIFYTTSVEKLATRLLISQSKLDQIIQASVLTLSSLSFFLVALRNDWMILMIVGLSYFLVGLILLILLATEGES